MSAQDIGKAAIAYNVNGQPEFRGVIEYVTDDGYAGIRQVGGRLDEWPTHRMEVLPRN